MFSQLQLFYQPLFDASSLRVCGTEALIRWHHPVRGLLSPGEFLDIAEEFGLLGKIDAWSRHAACQQMSHWHARGLAGDAFRMSFNVSAAALNQPDLDLAISQDCAAAGLPAGSMELEVTESVLVANFEKSAVLLDRIKESGVSIAIDDFGTGYSSMAYLKRLPASTLKIDRSFLFDVPGSEADCRVLKAMVVMAKSLGLRVVIEGVETREQAQLCRDYGAEALQGYFFSRPVPADEFETRFLGNRL